MRYRIATVLATLAMLVLFLAPSASQGQGGKGGKGKGKGGAGGPGGGFGGNGPGGFGGNGPGGFGGQGGGFGGGGFGGGFGGNNNADPAANFNFLANGRTFFMADENRALQGPLTTFLQERGINSGVVTKDLYLQFMQARANGQYAGGFGGKGGGKGGMGGGGGFGGAGGGGAMTLDKMNEFADLDFKRLDRDGNEQLDLQEMPAQLKEELSRWDRNADNLINIEEYRYFFYNKYSNNNNKRPGAMLADRVIDEDELDAKQQVFRLGKLPYQQLPSWWKELDVDPKDAQISLHEWRRAKGTDQDVIDEFKLWDRNDDGLITPTEAMYRMNIEAIQLAKENAEDAEENGWGNGKGSFGKGGKGKGGKGGKGGPGQAGMGGLADFFGGGGAAFNGADDGSGQGFGGKGKGKGGKGGGPGGAGGKGGKGGKGGGGADPNAGGGGLGGIFGGMQFQRPQ